MGPGSSSSDLPTRPRFSWDIRNVPWTDGKGNQEPYATAVRQWSALHGKLKDDNSNKIPEDLQGIMLQSQLYGRARDLCKSIPQDIIESKDGVQAIVGAVYKRDALAVISDVYHDFVGLFALRRGQNESFKNFESRFQAQMSKLHAHGSEVKLSEAVLAFALLANADVDATQRISVLANSAPTSSDFKNTSTTNDFLKAVSYSSISSVLRQCERAPSSAPRSNPLAAGSSNAVKSTANNKTKPKARLTPEQLADLKSRSKCNLCFKFGHWSTDHKEDGSLKNGVNSYDTPQGKSSTARTLTFHMAQLSSEYYSDQDPIHIGPLLDDGAPYSGIGETELRFISPLVSTKWNDTQTVFDPLPDSIADRPFWQYGSGAHSSEVRRILGSVVLELRTDNNNSVLIRHLVIEGSSQWVIGRNVTTHCNIIHLDRDVLQVPFATKDGKRGYVDEIQLVNHDMHSYVPHKYFTFKAAPLSVRHEKQVFCATANVSTNGPERSWAEEKKIVDKVHKHVCGHATYTDIKLLLDRNGLWNEGVNKYLSRTLEQCESCATTARPQPPRKVSISSLSRKFNELVCVDHFFLDQKCVFHAMDATTRYSAGIVVPDTSMNSAICALETVWISPFWHPSAILFDPAFNNDVFTHHLRSIDVEPRPIPPRRHNKNVLESKHKVIRDIFERLKFDCCNDSPTVIPLLIQQSLRISNDLYGNDVMSAYELAKGFSRPVVSCSAPVPIPADIVKAHETLLAKRKLTLILRSKATSEIPVSIGDSVQVFIKQQFQKRGQWSSPKPVLRCDSINGTVTVPGANGKEICAAVEDVRPAICQDELATAVQEALDELDSSIQIALEHDAEEVSDEDVPSSATTSIAFAQDEKVEVSVNEDDSFNSPTKVPTVSQSCAQPHPTASPSSTAITDSDLTNAPPSAAHHSSNSTNMPHIGADIEVYWPLDDAYYPGTVSRFTSRTGMHTIRYDDGAKEVLDLKKETWRYAETPSTTAPHEDASPTALTTEPASEAQPLQSSEVQLTPGQDLERIEQQTVSLFYDVLGSKEFMLHESHGLPHFVTQNAYNKEQHAFMKTVRQIPVDAVPEDANVIHSHVFYKIKKCDDGSFVLKARIAPHGNEDRDKAQLKTDSASCPPVGIRLLLSVAVINRWSLAKIDFKSAFLQTGEATRDVYMIPPRECETRRRFYWLLLAAAYGLVNASAKWQKLSDSLLRTLGFSQLVWVPQVFYKVMEGSLCVLAVKVVDDVLFAGSRAHLETVIAGIQDKYTLGTIVYAPGTFQFYGLTVCQKEDYTISIHGDEKLSSYEPYPIDRTRRKQQDEPLNAIELSAFRSLNSSIGWLGIAASPFCATASSVLQQKGPHVKVKDLVTQFNVLRNLKRRGSLCHYKVPPSGTYPVSVLVFSDASRSIDHGQLGFVAGLLFGEFETNSVFHPVSWSSHKSRRPVKSIGSAEVLAAGCAIDEGKVLKRAFSKLLDVEVSLLVVVDSKDLFDTLSTCRNATDRSIRADVSVIRYEFETYQVSRMSWIPGKLNFADPLTKLDSPLCSALELLLFKGEIPIDTSSCQHRSSNRSTG